MDSIGHAHLGRTQFTTVLRSDSEQPVLIRLPSDTGARLVPLDRLDVSPLLLRSDPNASQQLVTRQAAVGLLLTGPAQDPTRITLNPRSTGLPPVVEYQPWQRARTPRLSLENLEQGELLRLFPDPIVRRNPFDFRLRVPGDDLRQPFYFRPQVRHDDFYQSQRRLLQPPMLETRTFSRDGAFAEYTLLPVENLHAVPDHVPDEAAVFAEPLAAAYELLEQATIGPGVRVLRGARLPRPRLLRSHRRLRSPPRLRL